MKPSLLFLIFLFATIANSYPIQGIWNVVNVGNFDVPQDYNITLNITEFLFRNQSIKWVMQFKGCQEMKYLVEIQEDYLFIDTDTMLLNSEDIENCKSFQVSTEKGIISQIKKVFSFQIISEYMTFTDHGGKVLLKFQRKNDELANQEITGNWQIINLENRFFNQILEINQTHFLFCQKKASLRYEIIRRTLADELNVLDYQDEGCGFVKLKQALPKVKFMRPINNQGQAKKKKLQLYDSDDNLLMTLVFVVDLETARKLKVEQDRLQEQQQRKRQARIKQLQEQERITQLEARLAPSQSIVKVAENLTGTVKDIWGKWEIVSIFKLPIGENFEISITSTNIILSGGCNTHILLYEQDQKKGNLNIGALRSTKQQCKVNDDGLFVTGLQKIAKYSAKIEEDSVVVVLSDVRGGQVYELKRAVEYKTLIITEDPVEIKPPAPIPRPPPPPPKAIPGGRYLILLLKRRDIPRKFINIDEQRKTISFSICNELQFSFVANQQTKEIEIKKTSEDKAENCSETLRNRQKITIQFLQSAETFESINGDITISNQENGEIVALNSL